MTEMTSQHVNEALEVSSFLARISDKGVWLPVPRYEIGESLTFYFTEWEVPVERGEFAYSLSSEERARRVLMLIRNAARAIGGRWAKNDPNESSFDDEYYILTNEVHAPGGIKVRLLVDRYLNCERKAVGTKTVIKPAIEAQPERIVEEPVYERICHPLFANAEPLENVKSQLETAGA